MKVLAEIEKIEAKQEFFTDVTSVMFVSAKSVLLRWPSHIALVHALKVSCYLNIADYCVLRRIFPTWRRREYFRFCGTISAMHSCCPILPRNRGS